jgi:hypothetical protein
LTGRIRIFFLIASSVAARNSRTQEIRRQERHKEIGLDESSLDSLYKRLAKRLADLDCPWGEEDGNSGFGYELVRQPITNAGLSLNRR